MPLTTAYRLAVLEALYALTHVTRIHQEEVTANPYSDRLPHSDIALQAWAKRVIDLGQLVLYKDDEQVRRDGPKLVPQPLTAHQIRRLWAIADARRAAGLPPPDPMPVDQLPPMGGEVGDPSPAKAQEPTEVAPVSAHLPSPTRRRPH